jgi:hypothetical protein
MFVAFFIIFFYRHFHLQKQAFHHNFWLAQKISKTINLFFLFFFYTGRSGSSS